MSESALARVARGTLHHPVKAALLWCLLVIWARLGYQLAHFLLHFEYGPGVTDQLARVIGWVALVGVFPAVLVLILAVIAALAPERRFRRGLCQRCGYDLRGSTARCPECGQPFHWTEGKIVFGEDPNL